jgi:hypothetical protein
MLKIHSLRPTISDYALYRLAAAIHVRAVGTGQARQSIIRNLKRNWPHYKEDYRRGLDVARQRHANQQLRRQLETVGGLLPMELLLPEATADEEKSASVTQ